MHARTHALNHARTHNSPWRGNFSGANHYLARQKVANVWLTSRKNCEQKLRSVILLLLHIRANIFLKISTGDLCFAFVIVFDKMCVHCWQTIGQTIVSEDHGLAPMEEQLVMELMLHVIVSASIRSAVDGQLIYCRR